MVIRIADWVLRISGIIALVLGILVWVNILTSADIHMLFGILVTLSLIVIGIAFGLTKGGSWGLGGAAIVWAIIVFLLGVFQPQIQLQVGNVFWIIQVIHLLFGIVAIGLGEMINARYRRIAAAQAQSVTQ